MDDQVAVSLWFTALAPAPVLLLVGGMLAGSAWMIFAAWPAVFAVAGAGIWWDRRRS